MEDDESVKLATRPQKRTRESWFADRLRFGGRQPTSVLAGGPASELERFKSDVRDWECMYRAYEQVRDYIPPHVARLPGVLVGRELVNQLTLYTGEEVKIVSPLGQDTPMGPVPRTKPYRVAGRFFTGMYEYDL